MNVSMRVVRLFLALAYSFVLYPFGVVFTLFPKRVRFTTCWYPRLTALWTTGYLYLLGVKYSLSGRTDVLQPNGQNYVFIANHASLLDGLVLDAVLGERTHFYLSKSSLKYMPLVNIFFIRMHVLVERNNPRKAVRALKGAIDRAQTYKNDMIIFPEGRRYHDGNVHEFFHGFASAALTLSVPVVPLRLIGMHKLCTENSWLVDSYAPPIKLIVGEPMVRGESESLEQFSGRVRAWFKEI